MQWFSKTINETTYLRVDASDDAGQTASNTWYVGSTLGPSTQSGQISRTESGMSQNHPNPFNPSTSISYTLSSDGFVNISVYNILGQEVAVLVNGEQTAGTHLASWEASNVPGGIYFYTKKTGDMIITRKMTLVK